MADTCGIAVIGSSIIDEVFEPLQVGNLVFSDGFRYLEGEDYETEKIEYSVGGLAINDSIDLSRMQVDYPICIIGKIGEDREGNLIRARLKEAGLSDEFLITTKNHPTSKTQVIHLQDSDGNLNHSFRHFLGAMGSFKPDEIDLDNLDGIRYAIVGYGLLMPYFDRPDDNYGTLMGQFLSTLQDRGIKTVLDFVSPKNEQRWKFNRYRKSLRYVDVLSINMDQAEAVTGHQNGDIAARSLVEDFCVGTGVVHCGEEGTNYLYSQKTGIITQNNFKIPPEEFKGTIGAGDAFTTGLIHSMHQEWDIKTSLRYATAAASISIGSYTTTDAMREEEYILNYMKTRPVVETKE